LSGQEKRPPVVLEMGTVAKKATHRRKGKQHGVLLNTGDPDACSREGKSRGKKRKLITRALGRGVTRREGELS